MLILLKEINSDYKCPACDKMEVYLNEIGVAFLVKDINDLKYRNYLRGMKSMPILLNGTEVVNFEGGCPPKSILKKRIKEGTSELQ